MILSAWISAPRRITPDFLPPGRLQTGPAAARMRELNWNPSVRFSRFLRTKKDACGADAPTVSRTGSRPPFRDQDPYPDRSEHPRRIMHPALVLFVLPVPPPAVPGTSFILMPSCADWNAKKLHILTCFLPLYGLPRTAKSCFGLPKSLAAPRFARRCNFFASAMEKIFKL